MLIDSGASVSVVNDTLSFNKNKSFSREMLTSINGSTPVTRSGFATVGLIDMDGKHFKFSFEAKCAPEAELPGAGILSCSGYSVNLDDSSGVIRLPDENGIHHKVRIRRQSNGLPVMDISPEKPIFSIWLPQLIHDTLGHVSSDRLVSAFNKGWLTSSKPLDNLQTALKAIADDCATCKIGQSRQQNHGKRSNKRCGKPFEMVHMDVTFGPPRGSMVCRIVDQKACLTVTDEYTRFQLVYPVESNRPSTVDEGSLAQVLKEFKRDLALIQDHRRKCHQDGEIRLRRIHSDGGGDIKSVFGKFCDEHGMLFSKSDAGHPWQNGLAERTNQALKTIAKKLLIASGVPSEFWVYAMKYAATVRNITGVKVHNELQSPYYEVFGHGVDIHTLHPFGCRAYMARNVVAQNLSKQHPASRPDWCVSRFPVWFIGYSSVTLHPKKYVVVLSNSILKRQGSALGYVQETSELIFDYENYGGRPAPLMPEGRPAPLKPDLLPELSDRRDLDAWLNDLTRTSGMEINEYKSESNCDDAVPDEDRPQSGGEAALKNAGSALKNASNLDLALKNADADHIRGMDNSSLQDTYPGWGPSGFSPDILEEVEGGVNVENNTDVGTDQPTDDIAYLVNHFKETGRVSEDELTKHLIYLTYKYSHIQLQGGSYSDDYDERAHKVLATAVARGDDYDERAHKVLATAVARGDDYGKVIDESKVDFSESRAKELNGLLETTFQVQQTLTSVLITST